MPELPDVELYVARLRPRVVDRTLERIALEKPFALRSVEPPLDALVGVRVTGVSRLAKRIVVHFEGEFAPRRALDDRGAPALARTAR